MAHDDAATVLEIKKYPNRRLYDATRSCHVTTGELYDLVAGGQVVRVRDSKSGEDITNQVLLQALIERDPLKINAVPPMLIHLMIRANQQFMTSWFDQFLRWTPSTYQTAGRPGPPSWGMGWPAGGGWPREWAVPGWGSGGGPTPADLSPMAWMERFFRPGAAPPPSAGSEADDAEPDPGPPAEGPGEPGVDEAGPDEAGPYEAGPDETGPEEPSPAAPPPDASDTDIDRLSRQVAMLAAEVARLRSEKGDD